MRWTTCETPEQISQAQALRYEVFCLEKGWIEPGVCANGLEVDEYDEVAVHFLVLEDDSDTALGTCRLLLGSAQTLPAAHFLDLEALGIRPDEACEVSRLATRKAARSHSLEVFLGLMSAMSEWGSGSQYTSLLSVADVPLHRLMERIGMPFVAVGEPVEYLGSLCVPAVIDVEGTVPFLARVRGSRLEAV